MHKNFSNAPLVRELKAAGVNVTFDKVSLIPGQRLWQQIAEKIEDPDLDGWAILLTNESLQSEACKEELAYALDRALHTKGSSFPLLGLINQVQVKDIPPVLRTRLLVNLLDPQWPSLVISGLKKQPPPPQTQPVTKYLWEVYDNFEGDKEKIAVWVRPRFGELRNWRFIFPANANTIGWNEGSPKNGLWNRNLQSTITGHKSTVTAASNTYVVLVEGAGNPINVGWGCFIVFAKPFPQFVGFGTSNQPFGEPNNESIEFIPINR